MRRSRYRRGMAKPEDDIPFKPVLKRTRLNSHQTEFFGKLAGELIAATRGRSDAVLSQLPEYDRFILGAYACGFVCDDFRVDGRLSGGLNYRQIQGDPRLLNDCSFQTLRHTVHVLIRSEHHNSENIDNEIGVVRVALGNGMIDHIAHRLFPQGR